jgi:hypothetical protein
MKSYNMLHNNRWEAAHESGRVVPELGVSEAYDEAVAVVRALEQVRAPPHPSPSPLTLCLL